MEYFYVNVFEMTMDNKSANAINDLRKSFRIITMLIVYFLDTCVIIGYLFQLDVSMKNLIRYFQ